MYGGQNLPRGFQGQELTTLLCYAKAASQERLRCGRPQANNHFGAHCGNLGVQPWATGGNFQSVWFLMDATFAPRLPLEVLDRIGYVSIPAIDVGLLEGLVQQRARRTDKRMSCKIFLVARLFADKHHPCPRRPLPEHRLCAALP